MPVTRILTLTESHLNKIVAGRWRKHNIRLHRFECHLCRVEFSIGEEIASKRGHGKAKITYYHPACARKINLLD